MGTHRSRTAARACGGLALMLCLIVLTACATEPVDPATLAVDRSAPLGQRVRAVARLNDIGQLETLAWDSWQPEPVRRAAMRRLVETQSDAFWTRATNEIAHEGDARVLVWLCEELPDAYRDGARASLLKSLARPSDGWERRGRPEWIGLAVPKAEREAWLREQVAEGDATVDAWLALAREFGAEEQRDWLQSVTMDASLDALAWAVEANLILPSTREGLDWLSHLLDDPHRRERLSYDASTDHRRNFEASLATRHLPAWLCEFETGTADQSLQRAKSLITCETRPAPADYSTWFTAWRAQPEPVLGDKVVAIQIKKQLADRGVRNVIFSQADADHADTDTEYGGVLLLAPPDETVVPIPPLLKRDDRTYLPPPELFDRLLTERGLAYYHFHAQKHDHADYAKPGPGDQAMIDRTGITGVVFTFVDRNTLNVDVVVPGGGVIDLGLIERPPR